MLTSLNQVHEAIQRESKNLAHSQIGNRGIGLAKTALLFSGGLESRTVANSIDMGHNLVRFRVSMLLDTREYGIILPAVIQARYSGFQQVIISDDHTADAPYYTLEDAELLLTAGGRLAASRVLGIEVLANEDWGFKFDKWEIMPKNMIAPDNSPIVSCFEQEYAYWEQKSLNARMCGHCKKCFAVHTLQLAKYGKSQVDLEETTWSQYLEDAIRGMTLRRFNYGVEIFHLVHKHDGWDTMLKNTTSADIPAIQYLRRFFKAYTEKKNATQQGG